MTESEKLCEEHKVSGERLVTRVKELIREGNVRRIIVKNEDGETIMELPLTLGVVSALLLPALVALGAIAALAAHYTLEVERQEAETKLPAPVP
jgi:uncharacterized protein DUF4342